MYETYYDKLQTYFRENTIQCHYLDTDEFVLCLNTKNINKDLEKIEKLVGFNNLSENHELFSKKTKR